MCGTPVSRLMVWWWVYTPWVKVRVRVRVSVVVINHIHQSGEPRVGSHFFHPRVVVGLTAVGHILIHSPLCGSPQLGRLESS